MKAHTDLEQSKKLIELGIDVNTADMMWDDWSLIDEGWKLSVGYHPEIEKDYGRKCYPAWSLTALLEVLPTIDNGNRNPVICKDIRLNKWHVVYHGTAVEPTIDSGVYDNLVDACVEMIYKLKERDLL